MKDRTKKMFADELENMLRTMPMDKVRVTDLCQRCSATTPTFYYYFKDKYDLAAWVYLSDISASFGDKEPEYSPERIADSLKNMNLRWSLYKKLFADKSQNSIIKYGLMYTQKLIDDVVRTTTGRAPTKQELLEAKHHTYGIFGLQQEWIFGEIDLSPEELAQFLYDHTPDFLKEDFQHYRFRSKEILSHAGTGK
jgi:AcrR family transcriptional regulator